MDARRPPALAPRLRSITPLDEIVFETLSAATSERQGRLIDSDDGGSIETKKRQGYF